MEKQSGLVREVGIIPARLDVLHVAFGIVANTYQPISAQFSMADDAEVTVNGKKAGVGELFVWLTEATHSHFVTIHPDPQRYELSMKTEFSDTEPQ